MCGYSGVVYTSRSLINQKDNFAEDFLSFSQKVVHRGGQPLEYQILPNLLVAHSRLAFQDLSNLSKQPMWSEDKKWILIFNGEIYNYVALRKKIQKEFNIGFRSYGDSEVLLNGFLCYKEKILDLLEGEYSFTIFKADGTEVFAGRDPFGVKPLFVWCEEVETKQFSVARPQYSFTSSAIAVCSEIKGLPVQKNWDRDGFLRQATGLYEPIRAPFRHIIQVPQGSFLWAKKQESSDTFQIKLILNETPIRRPSLSQSQNDEAIYKEFYQILLDSTEERLVSDVELGVYLSGGIDSKTIAACYSHLRNTKKLKYDKKIKTFTIGFNVEKGFDETTEALNFAQAAGFDPHVCRVNYDSLDYSYPLAVYYSENVQPYTNGAAKWWLSRFARQHVQGVLTGDGADEVLCGYPSFRYAAWWKFIFKNRGNGSVFDQIKNHPIGQNWRDQVYLKRFEEHSKNPWLSGSSHAGSGVDFIESLHVWGVAHPLFGEIKNTAELLLGKSEASQWLAAQRESIESWFSFGFKENANFCTDPQNALFLWQNYFSKTHLPVQVLNWVGDRIEMANTLEGRPPFMSRQLKSFISNLNDNYFVRGFEEKSILKRSFRRHFSQFNQHVPVQKKQFNAPSLYGKRAKFYQERIKHKIQNTSLLDPEILTDLFAMSEIQIDHSNNNQRYLQSYMQSTLQMLSSFTYVDDFIVENKSVTRDYGYEERILSA